MNSEQDLAGYRVYQSATALEQDFNVLAIAPPEATSYRISGLSPGQKYYYALTAFDTSNNESVFSNKVEVSIIPGVIGETQDVAEVAIRDAGLIPGALTLSSHVSVPAGAVIDQAPPAGTAVPPGSQVDLVISLGPGGAPVTVPSVVGQDRFLAEEAIVAAGLQVGYVEKVATNSAPVGKVLSQDPPAGTSVAPGYPIDLGVSSGLVSDVSLVNAGVVTRYYFDEAGDGSVPTHLEDSASNPLPLPIVYDGDDPDYTKTLAGKGLEWLRAGADGRVSIPVAETKIRDRLNGKTRATIELVLDVQEAGIDARLVHIGASSESGYFTLHANTSLLTFFTHGETVRGQWRADWAAEGRHVLHLVLDTTLPHAPGRVKLYRNGELVPKLQGIEPDRHEPLSIPRLPSTHFVIGNREIGGRSCHCVIYYAAMYDRALSSEEVRDNASALLINDDGPLAQLVVGLGPHPSSGGWIEVLEKRAPHGHVQWPRLPWPPYNISSGETRLASCDLDGDGRDELVLGLGPYPSNGGWFEIKDDRESAYVHLAWLRVHWSAYNALNGETFPACGDLDGDGLDEIVVGLGAEGIGFMQAFDDATNGYQPLSSTPFANGWLRLGWSKYNQSVGVTRPAVGNLDLDGAEELALGVAVGGNGWVQVLDDAIAGFTPLGGTPTAGGWVNVRWSDYNASHGETRPAVCDLNGDGQGELVLGLGMGSKGWLQLFDSGTGFSPLAGTPFSNGWVRVGWSGYTSAGGGTRPACGDLDGDGKDELVFGLDSFPTNGGWVEVMDDLDENLSHLSWARVGWSDYVAVNGETRPVVAQ